MDRDEENKMLGSWLAKFDPTTPEYKERVQKEAQRQGDMRQEASNLKENAREATYGADLSNALRGFGSLGGEMPKSDYAAPTFAQAGADKSQANKLMAEANSAKPEQRQDDEMFKYLQFKDNKAYRDAMLDATQNKTAAEMKFKKDALAAKSAADAKKSAEGDKLPAAQVAELADMQSVDGLINNLSSSWDKNASATGSSVSQIIPGSDANLYNIDRNVAVSAVAKAIEGRAPTDSDMARYEPMFPKSSDTADRKEQKINALRSYAQSRINERKKAFEAYGYKNPQMGAAVAETPRGPMSGKKGGEAATASGHPPVTQNGHTYNWNEATGKYE